MKLCYMTWVYPSAEIYFDQFIRSLNSQKFKEIDLIFLDNGVNAYSLDYLESSLIGFNSLKIIKLPKGQDFKKIIVSQLMILKTAGFFVVIFGDVDDTFSPMRFQNYAFAKWEDYAFMYNNLKHMDTKKNIFSLLPLTVSTIDDIKSKNYIGMSMSAVNLNKIDLGVFKSQEINKILAFDWYFYSKLLLNGFVGKLVEGAETYYRIYPNNIAGDPNDLTHPKLISNLRIRDKHFRVFSKYSEDFTYLRKMNRLFIKSLKKDQNFYNKYHNFYVKKTHKAWWDLKIKEFLDNE